MVYARIRPERVKQRLDPLNGQGVDWPDRVTELRVEDMKPEAFRALYEQKWEPPTAFTFAGLSIDEARRRCANRPQVILREDPMFGRRGYAREVIEDAEHGYLVLVIAYVARKCPRMGWQEPVKPKDCDRRYWAPSRVEFI